MDKQSTVKTRYAAFVVSAALGLGVLAPGCFAQAEEATAGSSGGSGGPVTTLTVPGNSEASTAAAAAVDEDGVTAAADEEDPDASDGNASGGEAAAGAGAAAGGEASEATSNTAGNGETAESGSVAAAEATVSINDSYFGNTTLTVETGSSIGTQYNPDYATYVTTINRGTYNLTLKPSSFKDSSTGTVYTLEQLQSLDISGDTTFEVVNYTRKVTMHYFIIDGRPNPVDISYDKNLKIWVTSTNEVVYDEPLPELTYTNVTAQNTTGSKDTARIGSCTVEIELEHLDESTGEPVEYTRENYLISNWDDSVMALTTNANTYTGGYEVMSYYIPKWYTVSVSDASADNEVETSVDITYLTFGSTGSEKGVAATYTRTATATVSNSSANQVYWYEYNIKTWTYTMGETVRENRTIYVGTLPVISLSLNSAGTFDVYGVSNVTFEPHEIDGYKLVVTGDGLSRDSIYNIAYYREVSMSFDLGSGTEGSGSTVTATVLQGQPLSAVLEELPTPTAPDGYSFDGWTVNGEGDVIDLTYVPSGTEAFTLVASYSKDEETGTAGGTDGNTGETAGETAGETTGETAGETGGSTDGSDSSSAAGNEDSGTDSGSGSGSGAGAESSGSGSDSGSAAGGEDSGAGSSSSGSEGETEGGDSGSGAVTGGEGSGSGTTDPGTGTGGDDSDSAVDTGGSGSGSGEEGDGSSTGGSDGGASAGETSGSGSDGSGSGPAPGSDATGTGADGDGSAATDSADATDSSDSAASSEDSAAASGSTATDASTGTGTSATADKNQASSQRQNSKTQIAKTADTTTALPSALAALAGGVALAMAAMATAFARLRSRN